MKRRSRGITGPEALVDGDPIALLKSAHEKLMEAELLRQNQQFVRAERICLDLLRKFPDYYGALHTIGLVYGEMGKSALAVVYLVQAAMVNPRSWSTLTALAGEYLMLGAKEMATRVLRDALAIESSRPEVYVMLAEVCYEQREYVQAAEACRKALDLDPEMIGALQSKAGACIALGQHKDARDALEKLVSLKQPTVGILAHFAQLPAPFIRRDLIADLENIALAPDAEPEQEQIDAAFVRAAALDKMHCYEEAWKWVVKANSLMLPQVEEELAADLKSIEDRVSWFSNNLDKFKGRRNLDKDFPTSLFILGMSRSGKTTAEGIISSQPQIYRGYENPAIQRAITYAYQEGALIAFRSIGQLPLQLYPKVGEFYQDIIKELMGTCQVFTNTTPGHLWDAPLISRAVPNTKFIFIKRDFHDLLLRIFMKHYSSGNTYSYSLPGLKRYVTSYNKMIDLMAETFPNDSIIISYEDMIEDPAMILQRVSELCGFEPNGKRLGEIADDRGCSQPYRSLIDAALANV